MAMCFIEAELLPMKVLHCIRIGIFLPFRSYDLDLDLDSMTFINI